MYQHISVIITLVIKENDKFLTVTEKGPGGFDDYTLFPRDDIRINESVFEAAKRIALEKIGTEVELTDILEIRFFNDDHIHMAIDFWAEPLSDNFNPDISWKTQAEIEQIMGKGRFGGPESVHIAELAFKGTNFPLAVLNKNS